MTTLHGYGLQGIPAPLLEALRVLRPLHIVAEGTGPEPHEARALALVLEASSYARHDPLPGILERELRGGP